MGHRPKDNFTPIDNLLIRSGHNISHLAFRIFCALSSLSSPRPSLSNLQKWVGASKNSIKRAIKELEDLNIISIVEKGVHVRKATQYEIKDRKEWKLTVSDFDPVKISNWVRNCHSTVSKNDPELGQDLTPRKNKEKPNKKSELNFESLYHDYPRKEGKKIGLQRCQKQIKTQKDFNLLAKAIKNYALKAQRENIEIKYLKHFSSFMNCWTDYVDVDLKDTFKEKSVIDMIENLKPEAN